MANNGLDFVFKMWNLLNTKHKNDFEKYTDRIVALAHCVLVFNYEFECLGLGEEKTLHAREPIMEYLPAGWNAQVPRYTLRYKCKDKLYILFGLIANDLLVLNLLNVDTEEVTNVAFLLKESFQIDYEINVNVRKISNTFKELIKPSKQIANEMTIERLIDQLKSNEKLFFKGYELLLTIMQENVRNDADYAVLCIHFVLVFRMGMVYLDSTDNDSDGDEPMAINEIDKALTANWNNGSNHYVLRYRRYSQRFLLCVSAVGSILSLNFINCLDLSSKSLALNLTGFANDKKKLALEILEKLLKPIISLQLGPQQFARDIFKQNLCLPVNPDEDDAYL